MLQRLPKILVIVVIAAIIATAHFSLDRFVLSEFEKIEKDEARRSLGQALGALRAQHSVMLSWVRDFGAWDETYDFVQTRDADYIDEHFSSGSLANLDFDLVVIVDKSGDVIWSHAGKHAEFSDEELSSLPGFARTDEEWDKTEGLVGLHRVDSETVYLLAAHPILKSQFDGANRGTIIFGRVLDHRRLESMVGASIPDFALQVIHAGVEVPDSTGTVFVTETGDSMGRATLSDLNGQPVITVSVRAHRVVTAQGEKAVRAVMLALVIVSLVGGVLLLVTPVRRDA